MKQLMQLCLSVLRWLHVDLYAIMKRRAERGLWRRVWPSGGRLRDDGLCVAVDIQAFDSLAQVGRDFIDMIGRTAVPHSVFNLHVRYGDSVPFDDESVRGYLNAAEPTIPYRKVLIVGNRTMIKDGRYDNAITPFWEFDSGVPVSVPRLFDGVKHLVVFSDFCLNYFRRIAPSGVSVHKIRYPYNGDWKSVAPRETVRRKYGIPADSFAVFFHFNLGSSSARKNPEGALAAFEKAFRDDPKAHLVLKVAGAGVDSAEYRKLESQVRPFGDRVTLINARLSHQEILDLIAAADVYLSLHRGEGFGIGMLEAMSVGTPVICTNYGGNTDFCKEETAFLVDYKMVPNDSDEHFYKSVQVWPEPNVEQAAIYLRDLRNHPDVGRDKSVRASAFIRDFFSVNNFEADVRRFASCRSSGEAI